MLRESTIGNSFSFSLKKVGATRTRIAQNFFQCKSCLFAEVSNRSHAGKAVANFSSKNFNYNLSKLSATFRQNRNFGKMEATFVVRQPGYVYVYLSNDEASPLEVFFDDFTVIHAKGPVVQSQDYYPFGLPFDSRFRQNDVVNQYKYNSKEEQAQLSLGWTDYGLRMYHPDIGRWGIPDPSLEKYTQISPYTYCGNNPINIIDPNGADWIIERTLKGGKVVYNITLNAKVFNNTGQEWDITALAEKMKSQIEAVFSTSNIDGGVEVSTTVNIQAVTSLSQVKNSDHLIMIESNTRYNELAGANTNTNGYSDAGGLKIVIPHKVAVDILNDNNRRTMAHEIGHTGGLYHPNDRRIFHGRVQGVYTGTLGELERNLMTSNGEGLRLISGQMSAIYNNYVKGRLNQETHFVTKTSYILTPALHVPIIFYSTRLGVNYSMQHWASGWDKFWAGMTGSP